MELFLRILFDKQAQSQFAANLAEELERQYKRRARSRVLRKRRQWRSAHVSDLRQLDLPKTAERYIQEASDKKKGRQIDLGPTSLADALADFLNLTATLADPETPSHKRRVHYQKSPWYGRLIEAAYRGELEEAQRDFVRHSTPHQRPSELAEEKVAAAAGISSAQVRKIAFQVREVRRNLVPDDAMKADELAAHLQNGCGVSRTPEEIEALRRFASTIRIK